MFRKLFGKKKSKKTRLSPSASTPEGMMQSHPMYQYAMKEYAQTVPAETSNDDGKIRPTFSMQEEDELPPIQEDVFQEAEAMKEQVLQQQQQQQGNLASPSPVSRTTSYRSQASASKHSRKNNNNHKNANLLDVEGGGGGGDDGGDQASVISAASTNISRGILSPKVEYGFSDVDSTTQRYPPSVTTPYHNIPSPLQNHRRNIMMEQTMPDTTYEESYGDAYIGGPIKYIYPSGYQSMRPRSGPWKLSIAVCLLFTFLSMFVIGHCSDKYDATGGKGGGDQVYQYYSNNDNDDQSQQQQIDDDQYNIETKWCGSRPLYWMWVISMLITAIATAYCSVIGYIKVRDFAVANARSLPPGILAGGAKSDYYVQITGGGDGGMAPSSSSSQQQPSQHQQFYNKTIYQADGNPQFWGNQIYRPTQAAVAVTSR